MALTGLETFTQTAHATLRVEIDPRGEDLESTADDGLPGSGDVLFNVGSASGSLGGTLEVVCWTRRIWKGGLRRGYLHSLVRSLRNTRRSVFPLGHRLDTSALSAGSGVARDSSGDFSYDLNTVPVGLEATLLPDHTTIHTYDSVIQSSWFATRAILRSMTASECAVADAFSQESDTWFYARGFYARGFYERRMWLGEHRRTLCYP